MNRSLFLLLAACGILFRLDAGDFDSWPEAAGPQQNWQIEGKAPTHWSVTRGENVRWRTSMPEAGMSGVTVAGGRVFVTSHVPIETLEEKEAVSDIIGFCLDAETGEILWQVTLPGSVFISLAGGFTDGTVFAPISDGTHVWFFNRCGSMGCYDFEGNEVWFREWTPRFKHNNRQAEPSLVGDSLIYVEVADKEAGAKMQKWEAPGLKSKNGTKIPEGVEEESVYTYLHGIDKRTGEVLWRADLGTSIHTTPVVGQMSDGRIAISHARGGPHAPIEKPYGHSLTSLEKGNEGRTIWKTELQGYDSSFACHWNERFTFGFLRGKHLVMDTASGEVLREQPLYESASLWKYNEVLSDWKLDEGVAVKAGKGHPNTNQANLVVGDWHWFLSHNVHYLGRVHVGTGEVEYLELPAQLIADANSRTEDQWLWGDSHPDNRPLNSNGLPVGDKGHAGTGWGHISAASPTRIGRYLYLPVVTGTVYVIDLEAEGLSPDSLVAVNDLGLGKETWTLAPLTSVGGRLYAHTMKEVICIEGSP
ncbi:MAG: PQQ-binding-like beta-propeller repeat protein [Verrucomicrobiota bacterium]